MACQLSPSSGSANFYNCDECKTNQGPSVLRADAQAFVGLSLVFKRGGCGYRARRLLNLRFIANGSLFATNLRRLRHAKGLSHDDLAYEAAVSRSYLSQIEKAR